MTAKSPPRPSAEWTAFDEALLEWWQSNKRDYPWRNTTDPYQLLVAEVLLHRTRADQVVPLFDLFLAEYPIIEALAAADRERVRNILAPAGLRWRVDLLVRCAEIIVSEHNGNVPFAPEALIALPGVGHYIAAAIRCFAFGFADAVVDTNTVRIASRVLDFPTTDSSRRNRSVHEKVKLLVAPSSARYSNFALLDLGALVCTAREPACKSCPVEAFCITGRRRLSGQ